MKILGRTQMIEANSLPAAVEQIGSLGFDGAEVCLERKDWSVYAFDAFVAAAVAESAGKASLDYVSLSFHQDYIYNDDKLAETLRVIPFTRDIGADVFVFSGCKAQSDDAEEWDRMIARTRQMVAVAEDHGVTLAIEFEPNFVVGSTPHLLKLFSEIESPALAANLDLGHVFLCDPDPLAAIRQLGNKIVHCHIENMGAGVHRHLLPWEGDMDIAAYIQALRDAGFDGGLAFDMYDADYAAVAGECVSYLRSQGIS